MGQVDDVLGSASAAEASQTQHDRDVAALVEMGYEAQAAKQALLRAGNVDDAALQLSTEKKAEKERRYSTEPLDGPCMAMTSPVTGERVYIPLDDAPDQIDEWSQAPPKVPATTGGLLGRSMSDILRAVEQRKVDRALEESSQKPEASQPAPLSKQEARERKEAKALGEHKLWADKYTPKTFMDLLSEGSVNREVLRWVKSWDECVFGEAPKEKRKQSMALGVRVQEEEKADNRPETKVILIAGPPGVGKTTLAHVVAKHAGYNGIEINASDDRSANVLLQRLEDATGMQALLPGGKPNCVIMDEIDGVDSKATIATLLQMIERGDKQQQGEDAKGKKRKRPVSKLKRPIICMCNDQYVPALYNLRHKAQVYTLRDIDLNMLTARLDAICRKEGMKTDRNALVTLAEESGRDIRSCLNVLQFLQSRGARRLTKAALQRVPMLKDATKSLFDIWTEIFLSGGKKKGQSMRQDEVAEGNFEATYSVVLDGGDTQKVLDGVFENMLLVKYPDPLLEKTSGVSDWLGLYDIFDHHSRRTGDFGMMRYAPAVGVAAKAACSSPNEVKFELPSSQNACRRSTEQKQNVVSAFLMGLSAESRISVTRSNAVLDFFSAVNHIVHPQLKPGSTLRSDDEQEMVLHLVDTMLRLGLTWKPMQGEDYRYTYQLEPAIHTVTAFQEEGKEPIAAAFTDKHKQTLAHQIELERMRRLDRARHGEDVSVAPSGSVGPSMTPSTKPAAAKKGPVIRPVMATPPSALPVPDSATSKKHISVMGYLQRPDEVSKAPAMAREQHPVFFRFQEGFSAAVRRPVYVKDFGPQ